MLLHDPPENGSWIEGLDILEISVGPARKSREIFEILWNLEKSLKSSKSLKSPEIFTFSTDFKDFTAKKYHWYLCNQQEIWEIPRNLWCLWNLYEFFEIFEICLNSLKSVGFHLILEILEEIIEISEIREIL